MSVFLNGTENVKEIFDPIKDFYKMRDKKRAESLILTIIPFLLGIVFLGFDLCLETKRVFSLDSFIVDFLNQIITMLTLFISFSMAYLSIIITSSSENVQDLKTKESKCYKLKDSREPCTLYQVLVNEITYTLLVEIIFLMVVLFEKFLLYLCSDIFLKYIIAVNIVILSHVLLVMMITVKDIYYSFWKSI